MEVGLTISRPRSHVTLRGVSPLTSHRSAATSPLRTVTSRDCTPKYGAAVDKGQVKVMLKVKLRSNQD